jgi:hypothetical protein
MEHIAIHLPNKKNASLMVEMGILIPSALGNSHAATTVCSDFSIKHT